jgi:trehalose 6-phosphate phosphatase
MGLPSLRLHLDAVAHRLRQARGLDVAMDFDGTLAPFVDRPADAHMDRRARVALQRLSRLPHARIAVLSGRRLADLRRRVHIPGAYLVGTAGLEPSVDGHVTPRPPLPPLPKELKLALGAWSERFPGAWIERKGLAMSVHFAQLHAHERATFLSGVRRRIAPFADTVEAIRNSRTIELSPLGGANKGMRLRDWHRSHPRGTLLVYLGDDANDLPALAYTNASRGIAITVGRPLAGAHYRIDSPRHAAAFLDWLGRTWAALHPPVRSGRNDTT